MATYLKNPGQSPPGDTPAIEKLKYEKALKTQDQLYQQSLVGSRVCDVTLRFGDNVVKAHWCVLITCPYFQALYDSGVNESVSGEVKLVYEDTLAMKAAIRFLYTGRLELSLDNVQQILEVADYLLMEDLTARCGQFLEDTEFTHGNCVQIMLMASQFNLDTAYSSAFRFVGGHLPELLQSDELLDISKASVLSFFQDHTLFYVKREDFFQFLVRWTEKDQQNRAEHFPELFKGLNFLLVTENVLDTILSHPLVQQSEDCQLHCQAAKERCSSDFTPCGTSVVQDIIVLGGGVDDIWSNRFVRYSQTLLGFLPQASLWVALPDLPIGVGYPLMAMTEQGKLLVMDSVQDGMSMLQSKMFECCFQTKSWREIMFTHPFGVLDYDYEFHSLHVCSDRVLVVASSEYVREKRGCQRARNSRGEDTSQRDRIEPYVQVHLLELKLKDDMFSLLVKATIFQRPKTSKVQVACHQRRDRAKLDGDFIYISCFDCTAPGPTDHHTKLFVYDVKTDCLKKIEKKIANKSLALGLPEGLVSCDIGAASCEFFSQEDEEIISSKDYAVSSPPFEVLKESIAYMTVDKHLYVFGGESSDCDWSGCAGAQFSFASQSWIHTDSTPVPMVHAGIARGRIPLDVLGCHVDCPHCFFKREEKIMAEPRAAARKSWRDVVLHSDSDFSNDDDSDSDYFNESVHHLETP